MTPEEQAKLEQEKLDRETELAEDDLDRVHGGFMTIIPGPLPNPNNPTNPKPTPPVKIDPNPRGAMPCE